ncbi:MAG: O-antigen ligase family protein [Caulobacteraceae bacterium]|nr:O-antigen ligase family protein [Caulobacteraceae bacterium]
MAQPPSLTVSRGRSTVARERSASVSTLEKFGWGLLMFWLTGPWYLLLSGANPSGANLLNSVSPLYSYISDVVPLIPLAVLIYDRNRALALLRRCWPFAAFLLLTMLLLVTAQDVKLCILRFWGYLGTVFAVLGVFTRLSPKQALRCLAYMLAASFVLNILTVFLLPRYGITGGTDVYGASSSGEWRGLYNHKNVLGQFCGVSFGVLVVTGRDLLRPTALWLVSLALALLCIYKASSSTGLVLAAILPGIYYGLLWPRGVFRVLGGIAVAIGCTAILLLRGVVVDSVLRALGKGETLSGRTDIWHVAREFAGQYPITGAGYDYSNSAEMTARFFKLFNVPNAHNAYLDALINLGWIDTAVLGAAVIGALVAAWSRRLPEQLEGVRNALTLFLAAWLISGTDEVMAMKPLGALPLFGAVAIIGLYNLKRYGERIGAPARASSAASSRSRSRSRRVDQGVANA